MSTLDGGAEWRRLSEHYGRMSDGELVGLARKKSELTEVAQEALANEMSVRRLKVPPEVPAAPPPSRTVQQRAVVPVSPESDSPDSDSSDSADDDSAYDEDRQLITISTVWSVADALRLQQLLDGAGIPFFMGPEMATEIDAVTTNFANGVDVKIMNVGLPWARQVLQDYFPKDEPESERREREEEIKEVPVRCPKCHSTEVVFDDLVGEPPTTEQNSPQQFEWSCDSCGHHWKDDGIVRE
jgi:DNA-directed RNA polymerase subunit M/transcription elongation factor TFIIS